MPALFSCAVLPVARPRQRVLFGCSFCAVAVSIAFGIFCAHAALAAPDDGEEALPRTLLLAYALLLVIDSAYRGHDLLCIQSCFRKQLQLQLHAGGDDPGQPLDLDVFASAPAAAGFVVNAVAAFCVVCWVAREHLSQRSCYGGDARPGQLCAALDVVSFSLIAWTSLAALWLCGVVSCACCCPAAMAPRDDAAHQQQEQARYEDDSVVLVPMHSPAHRQYAGPGSNSPRPLATVEEEALEDDIFSEGDVGTR
eukprot:Tamp_16561.p1 GENE.Tamp_16561~~Tamp_16561.p1  ORF type:complete len:253 (-),score=49.74 Tamp_16561:555-1313(-)